jgi:D-alanyl-D-alanine carboxypeptidase
LTKPFIAVLTLRLAEERRLSLTDTVGRWLGPAVTRSVRSTTIRQLLGHTSDVADYILDPDVQAALRDPRHPWTEKELLRAMRSAGFRGGTFNYSNSNYVLLGAILRRATGGSVDALLDKEILSRLRVRRTSLRRRGGLARDVAGGGRLGTGVWGELFTDGGMVSSARDVARFLDALLVQRRLLEPQTLRRMLTPGPDGRYELGLEQSFLGGSCEFWGHGGFWDGWATAGATELTSGSTIVVLLRDAGPGDAYTTASLLAGALGRHGAVPCS